MKKAVLIPIIVGGALLASATAFFVVGVVYNANTTKLVTNEYSVEGFSKLDIETAIANIEIRKSDDESSKVICIENNKIPHLVRVEDNALKISPDDKRNWFDKAFSFSTFDTSLIVYMPSKIYESSNLKASTGNISIPKDFIFTSLNVESSTGNQTLKCSVVDKYNVSASTGNIDIETAASDLVVNVSTGNVTVAGSLNNLNAKASTGHITLNNLIATQRFQIKTSTSDVKLNDSDASYIDIETSTGSVSGTLLSYKTFEVKTSTGKINIPPSILGGNPCNIKTSTGDINITIKE